MASSSTQANNAQQQQQQQQQQMAKVRPSPPLQSEVEMARQDAMRVCNPDVTRSFSSFEDACERLLPFHILADYDGDDLAERVVDGTPQVFSRAHLWNETLESKIREFQSTFDNQLHAFNALARRRNQGDLRSEERFMVEQILFQDEKQRMLEIKNEVEAREAERAAAAATAARMHAEAVRAAQAEAAARIQAQNAAAAAVAAARMHPAAQQEGFHFATPQPRLKTEDDNGRCEEEGMMDGILNTWGDPVDGNHGSSGGGGENNPDDLFADDVPAQPGINNGFQDGDLITTHNTLQSMWKGTGPLDLNAIHPR